MNRKSMYAFIKENNLEQEVVSKYGKNYTTCKNNELEDIINSFRNNNKAQQCNTTQANNGVNVSKIFTNDDKYDSIINVLSTIVVSLKGEISDGSYNAIVASFKQLKDNNSQTYSSSDILDMFNNLF